MSPNGSTEHNPDKRASPEEKRQPIEIRTDSFPPDAVEMSHVKTRQVITWLIMFGVFIVFLLHLASVFYFARFLPAPLDAIDKVFNMWVPVFTGLLGTAVGFYFADRRR